MYPEFKVKIRKKYEKALRDRFNYDLAERGELVYKVINVRCPLCDVFYKGPDRGSCKGCPFNKFSPQGITDGCLKWSRNLIHRWNEDNLMFKIYVGWDIDCAEVCWGEKEDRSVRDCLPRFAELALGHIIFY